MFFSTYCSRCLGHTFNDQHTWHDWGEMSEGDDEIFGGDGEYSQVNFRGSKSDYSFEQNDDGSISAFSNLWGFNILHNIIGFVFDNDGWYSADQVLEQPADEGEQNVVEGTDGDDYFEGTDGDDVLLGFGGVDVFENTKGDDIFDGGEGEYSQVNYRGSKDDYVFSRNDDGTITSTSDEYGTDILENIHAVVFDDSGWFAEDDLVG